MTSQRRTRQLPFSLLIISDGCDQLAARITSVLAGAARDASPRLAVLLRDKHAGARQLCNEARALRPLTRSHGALLIVSDRLDVALLADADGVHLPEAGLDVAEARQLLGPQRFIGVSRHDLPGVRAAERAGADYATLSPVFTSPEKGEPLGVSAFAAIARDSALPLFALGGVTAARVPELVQAGARGIAVMREIMAASQPAVSLCALQRALASSQQQQHPSLAPSGAPG